MYFLLLDFTLKTLYICKTSIANCNSNHTIYFPLIFWHEELPHINAHVQFSIWQKKTHRTVRLTTAEMNPTRPNTYQDVLDL